MIFNEGPESTRQLWIFLLKISKIKKKGGVCEFDLSPMSITFVGSILSEDEGRDLDVALLLGALVVTEFEGNEEVETKFKAFNYIFCCFLNSLTS